MIADNEQTPAMQEALRRDESANKIRSAFRNYWLTTLEPHLTQTLGIHRADLSDHEKTAFLAYQQAKRGEG